MSLKYLFIILSIGIALEFRCRLDALLVLGLWKQKVKDYSNSSSLKYEFGIYLTAPYLRYI